MGNNVSQRLAGSNIMFKSFSTPPGRILSKTHSAIKFLTPQEICKRPRHEYFYFSLQMELQIGLSRMYVTFNSCEVTILEKPSVLF